MEIFAQRLRERAAQLGISNAEAARRSGLDERRYAHYASNRREPDLTTLLRIANALATTPNSLLGLDAEGRKSTRRSALLDRLLDAASAVTEAELKVLVVQAEALVRE